MGRSKRRRTRTRTRKRTKRNQGRTLRRFNRRSKIKRSKIRRSKIRRKRTKRRNNIKKREIRGGALSLKQLGMTFIAAISSLFSSQNQATALPINTETTALNTPARAPSLTHPRLLQSSQAIAQQAIAQQAASEDEHALSSTEKPNIDYHTGRLERNGKLYRWESIYYRINHQFVRLYYYYNIDDAQDFIWAADPRVSPQTEGSDEASSLSSSPWTSDATLEISSGSLGSDSGGQGSDSGSRGSDSGSDSFSSDSQLNDNLGQIIDALEKRGISREVLHVTGALITIGTCIVACRKLANILSKQNQKDNVEIIVDIASVIACEESKLDATKYDKLEVVRSPSPAEMVEPEPEPVAKSKEKKGKGKGKGKRKSPRSSVAFGASGPRSYQKKADDSCVFKGILAGNEAGPPQGRRQIELAVNLPMRAWA